MRGAQENFTCGKGWHFYAAVVVVINVRACAHHFLVKVKCDFMALSRYGYGYFVQTSVRKHAHRNAIKILPFVILRHIISIQIICQLVLYRLP
jgi:hypothetical protein